MKITPQQFEHLKNDALAHAEKVCTLRKGQAVWNYMYTKLEHLEPPVRTLGRDDVDCYYRDDLMPAFFEALEHEIVNTEDYH